MASSESKKISMKVNPTAGQSQVINRVSHIFNLKKIINAQCTLMLWTYNLYTNLLDKEFEFSRSFSSLMICPEDIDDSSCLAKHCSVFRMSLLWQPYSFFKIIGKDSAKFTLEFFYNTLKNGDPDIPVNFNYCQ